MGNPSSRTNGGGNPHHPQGFQEQGQIGKVFRQKNRWPPSQLDLLLHRMRLGGGPIALASGRTSPATLPTVPLSCPQPPALSPPPPRPDMSAYAWRAADGAPIPLDHPRWLAREAWRPPLAALLRQLRSLRALPAAQRRYAWHSLTDRVVAPDCGLSAARRRAMGLWCEGGAPSGQ